jgi:predicted dehydrogenase
MRIGIVGPAERAVAWENHLRPHRSVSEVVISAKLSEIGDVDACLLMDESTKNLDQLLTAVKAGYHTFLVAPIPTNTKQVEKVYHAAEESNVLVQFSHWPTLAPASKWMSKKIAKPSFLQINRELNYSKFIESDHPFEYYWIDELAFCLRWINGSVHHIDIKTVELSEQHLYVLHMLLRFENGSTANIFINVTASKSRHHRLAASNHFILDCNVLEQTVRLGEENGDGHLFFNSESFDASRAAELAALDFLKSIQLKRETVYNAYHLWKLNKTIDKIKKRLKRT